MTTLRRAIHWFVEPAPEASVTITPPAAEFYPPDAIDAETLRGWLPPIAADPAAPALTAEVRPAAAGPGAWTADAPSPTAEPRPRAAGPVQRTGAAEPPRRPRKRRRVATDPPATTAGAPPVALPPGLLPVTCAAVLGRPGEAEPVAASLALALRRRLHAKAATVIATGGAPADPDSSGGSSAARRVAAAFTAHGIAATARGRLTWVTLPPDETQAVAAARRAALVGPPAVLALIAPRTEAWDELLAEQDLLVVVTPDPEGPLVRLATSTLPPVPIRIVRPLPRGLARNLARAGLKPTRPASALLTAADEAVE